MVVQTGKDVETDSKICAKEDRMCSLQVVAFRDGLHVSIFDQIHSMRC